MKNSNGILGLGILLTCLILFSGNLFAQTIPTGFQEYFIIGNDEHVYKMFEAVYTGEGRTLSSGTMVSVVGAAASTDNQVVYYDHWEDGYEIDILDPIQTTTLVLGDGDPSNGDTQDYTSDTRIASDLILRGTNLTFNSDGDGVGIDRQMVPIPRTNIDYRYDGGDRVYCSGGPMTLIHYQNPDSQYIGGATEIISRQAVENAYSYSIPVGTDTYTRYGGDDTAGGPFKYVFLNIVAFEDDTEVFIDNKGGGTASFTLNQGQHYSSQGLIDFSAASSITILEGTKVSTNKPIAGVIFTGGDLAFQTRFYALLPDIMHSTDFIITAPGDDPAEPAGSGGYENTPLNIYVYNPDPNDTISVVATDSNGSYQFDVPPNMVVAYTEAIAANGVVPSGSTVRLTGDANFWGISAYSYDSTFDDWGHSWLANKFLTNTYSVTWSPGTMDPAAQLAARGSDCSDYDPSTACDSTNRSPIFISAIQDNTEIRIDLDNDGVYELVDTNSDDAPDYGPPTYNPCVLPGCNPQDPELTGSTPAVYYLNALESLRVYDYIDYENEGTQIVANKKVAVAFGQDTDQAWGNDETLDLGNVIYPLDQRWLDPVLTIDMVASPVTVSAAGGGSVTFTITLNSYEYGPLTDIDISAILPADFIYQSGSTTITYPNGYQISGTTPQDVDPCIDGTTLIWDKTTTVPGCVDNLFYNTMDLNQSLVIEFTANLAAGTPDIFTIEAVGNGTLGFLSIFSPRTSVSVVRTDITMTTTLAQINGGAPGPSASPGDVLTYQVDVSNNGLTLENDIVVTTPLPDNTFYNSGTITSGSFVGAYDPAQNAIVWTSATFPASGSETLTFEVEIISDVLAGTVLSCYTTYESNETPSFQSNSVETTIVGPRIEVISSGPATALNGQEITIEVEVENTGDAAATNLLIVNPFPTNSAYVSESMEYSINGAAFTGITDDTGDSDPGFEFGDRLEFLLASLAAGDTVIFRFRVDVTGSYPDYINSQATASSDLIEETDSNLVQIPIVLADLSTSTKTVVDINGGDPEPEDVLRFTITLTESSGVLDATASVTDTLSAFLDSSTLFFVSIPSGATNNSAGNLIDISGIVVSAGTSEEIVFEVEIISTATTGDIISNTATIANPGGQGATPSSEDLVVYRSNLPSSGNKQLYMRYVSGWFLTRVFPATTDPNYYTTIQNTTRTWNYYDGLQSAIDIEGEIQVPIQLEYYSGTPQIRVIFYQRPNASAGFTEIGRDTWTVPNGFSGEHIFSITSSSYTATYPAGSQFRLTVTEYNGGSFYLYFSGQSQVSSVSLPASSLVNVDSVGCYNAAYSGGVEPASFEVFDSVFIRAVGSDPFGSFDVSQATVQLINPDGVVVLDGYQMTEVNDSGNSTKTFEFEYQIPSDQPRGVWTAWVTAYEGEEKEITHSGSQTFNVRPLPPQIDSPVLIAATEITGTSVEPEGTTITVYYDSGSGNVLLGTTTVDWLGNWVLDISSLSNPPPFLDGDELTATATLEGVVSNLSNPVYVYGAVTDPPLIDSPVFRGETSISGTSTEQAGTLIDVYVDGFWVGQTTVQADGTWDLPLSFSLNTGQELTATATDTAGPKGTSPLSAPVYVAAKATRVSDPPVINAPVYEGATTVSGTSTEAAGSIIDVFADDIWIGSTTVQADGTWSLTGVSALSAGQRLNATATNIAAGEGTSPMSEPVYVGAIGGATDPPVVDSPIYTGSTSITGTSSEQAGTRIDVFVDNVWIGQTTVQADGTWSLSGINPLFSGQSVKANATDIAGGKGTSPFSNIVYVSSNPVGETEAPVVVDPVYTDETEVTGTSTEPTGTQIDVYVDDIWVGQTTVQSDGTWELTGLTAFTEGQVINATATASGKGTSGLSNSVVVLSIPSDAPIVDGPLLAGDDLTITGSSIEPEGSVITVYVNGFEVGTTTVLADGTWLLDLVDLYVDDEVYATVKPAGKTLSADSNYVYVGELPDMTEPPVITAPIASGATEISGTGPAVAETIIDVFADGVYLGTTKTDEFGNWTLSGLEPLDDGTVLEANATEPGKGTSDFGAPVVVGTAIHMLRSDIMTDITDPIAINFKRSAPLDTAMDPFGANHHSEWGEGSTPENPGSDDDDKAYMWNITSGDYDPELTVLSDNTRPLIYYELLDNDTMILYLEKEAGRIKFTFTAK